MEDKWGVGTSETWKASPNFDGSHGFGYSVLGKARTISRCAFITHVLCFSPVSMGHSES